MLETTRAADLAVKANWLGTMTYADCWAIADTADQPMAYAWLDNALGESAQAAVMEMSGGFPSLNAVADEELFPKELRGMSVAEVIEKAPLIPELLSSRTETWSPRTELEDAGRPTGGRSDRRRSEARAPGVTRAIPGLVLDRPGGAVPCRSVLTTYALRESAFWVSGRTHARAVPQPDRSTHLLDPDSAHHRHRPRRRPTGHLAVVRHGLRDRFRFSPRAGRRIFAVVIAAGIASFLVRIFAWATILNGNGLVDKTLQAIGSSTSQPSLSSTARWQSSSRCRTCICRSVSRSCSAPFRTSTPTPSRQVVTLAPDAGAPLSNSSHLRRVTRSRRASC